MAMEDLFLFVTFGLSEVVLHSLRHVHGLLFLAALLLILWTKHIIRRWRGSQILQADFFKKLCYLMLTILLSLLGVFFVWVPLYEVYARLASMLDPTMREVAMRWRGTFFVTTGAVLFATALSRTDFFLQPYVVSETKLSRAINYGLELILTACRLLYRLAVNTERRMLAIFSPVLRALDLKRFEPPTLFKKQEIKTTGRRNLPSAGSVLDVDPAAGKVVLQEVTGCMPVTPGRHTLIVESVVPANTAKKVRRSADFSVISSTNLIPERNAPTTRSQKRTFEAEVRGSGSKVRVLRQISSINCKCPKERARRP